MVFFVESMYRNTEQHSHLRSVRVSAETRSTSKSLVALGTAAARPPPALADSPTLVVPQRPRGAAAGVELFSFVTASSEGTVTGLAQPDATSSP